MAVSNPCHIIVYNLGVRRALAYKVNPKATLVYSLDLFK
jgi:hypothetical protein